MPKPSAPTAPTASHSTLLALFCAVATAQSTQVFADALSASTVPDSAFYIGLGGTASPQNSTTRIFAMQPATRMFTTRAAVTSLSSGFGRRASRRSGMDSDSSMSAALQLGITSSTSRTANGCGVASLATTTYQPVQRQVLSLIPQFGSYGSTPFTGNAIVR